MKTVCKIENITVKSIEISEDGEYRGISIDFGNGKYILIGASYDTDVLNIAGRPFTVSPSNGPEIINKTAPEMIDMLAGFILAESGTVEK